MRRVFTCLPDKNRPYGNIRWGSTPVLALTVMPHRQPAAASQRSSAFVTFPNPPSGLTMPPTISGYRNDDCIEAAP